MIARAIALDPAYADVLANRRGWYLERNNDEATLSDFERTLAVDPEVPMCFIDMRGSLRGSTARSRPLPVSMGCPRSIPQCGRLDRSIKADDPRPIGNEH
jgi:hypothetical protein